MFLEKTNKTHRHYYNNYKIHFYKNTINILYYYSKIYLVIYYIEYRQAIL